MIVAEGQPVWGFHTFARMNSPLPQTATASPTLGPPSTKRMSPASVVW